jgi:gluconolactonase
MWNHVEGYLIFSDMPGNIMRKWTNEGGIEVFREPSNMANGNYYDLQGRLVTCEHSTSRVTRTEHDGSITVLATHYDDKELNSPNDIIVKSDGSIYFTDPSFGRMDYYGVEREQELDWRGVYRLSPGSGELTLLVDDFDQPNGLTFSLNESQLFINDTMRAHIRVFDVNDDGTISNGRVWADVTGERDGLADGMKVDTGGYLYTTGPGGVQVFADDATCLGTIYVPQGVTNFTWGDDDLCSLYINAGTSLYRTRVKVPGRKLF